MVGAPPIPSPSLKRGEEKVERHTRWFGSGGGNSSLSEGVKLNEIVGAGWRPRWFVLHNNVLSYYKIHGPTASSSIAKTGHSAKVSRMKTLHLRAETGDQ
ncbi:hypothetical protein GUJ93_ZPchr0009g1573 [Zizania palustris]|uniref:PH domain-containing protein n=1 Tax=Zizania palustris TaxID=103762 RepID=A0A8J5RP70_ZIZPA|nr:hypothetical protein GUJ93_ZPchr0009g1573 [Zizania palustris]